jgi:uncharacterized protein
MTSKSVFYIALALLASPALAADAAAPAAPATAAAPASTDWHETVRRFTLDHCRHPAWGFSHAERDYALAKALAARDGVPLDDDVMFAAAYLHDIAAFKPFAQDGVDHSDTAANLVGGILAPTGFPMAKLAAVQAAIRTHMYYRDPIGAEALYLHDADALDWLGAIGVARITAIVDPNGGMPDGKAAVAMLRDNLAKVPSRVLSPAGKALLPARQAELQAYLDALSAETQGYDDL